MKRQFIGKKNPESQECIKKMLTLSSNHEQTMQISKTISFSDRLAKKLVMTSRHKGIEGTLCFCIFRRNVNF